MMGKLQVTLPKIRRGSEAVLELNQLLQEYVKSAFRPDITKFLDRREKEIQLLKFILNLSTYKDTNVDLRTKDSLQGLQGLSLYLSHTNSHTQITKIY